MPLKSRTLIDNKLLTSKTYMIAQKKHLAVLKTRMDENLSSYKKMLAAVEAYVHKHFQDEEGDAFLALFAQDEYNLEVVKRARAAHFKDEKPERNPLFLLAEDLSSFLETVAPSRDEMNVELARHAINLAHDMFLYPGNYDHKNAEDFSKTLQAAGEYYKDPLNPVKHQVFAESVTHLAENIDERSSLDNFIMRHPKLALFAVVALITLTVASMILMMIPTLPHLVPLFGAGMTCIFGMTSAFGVLMLGANKERAENKSIRIKDEKVDNLMACLKNYSFFAPGQNVAANAVVKENEQPLLGTRNGLTV